MEHRISPSTPPQPSNPPTLDPDTAWKLWQLADEHSTELWMAFDRDFSDRVLCEMQQRERSPAGPTHEEAD